MARPVKNNLDYFSHDKDMRNDVKIRNVRRKFGHKGYSIYVMMLEHLSDCEYLQYEWNELSIELLVPDFDINTDELIDIINHCVKLKLFELEFGVLYCPTLYQRNNKVLTDRKSFDLNNSLLSNLKGDLSSKSEINYSFPSESTYSIVKDSKEENSKEEDSIVKDSKEEDSKEEDNRKMIVDKLMRIFKNDIDDNIITSKEVEGLTISVIRPVVNQVIPNYPEWEQHLIKYGPEYVCNKISKKYSVDNLTYSFIKAVYAL